MKDLFVPALGMAMEECQLVEWLKQPGEEVASGEPVAVIETDKAEMELEAPVAGRLGAHLYAAGATVPVGETVTHVLEDGEEEQSSPAGATSAKPEASGDASGPDAAQPQAAGQNGTEQPDPATAEPAPVSATVAPNPKGSRTPHTLSPRQRRLAALKQQERGSGMTVRHRAAVAQAVTESWDTIPHFGVTSQIRADVLLATLGAAREEAAHVTATDLLLRAFGLALAEKGRGGGSIGLAVATDRGVAVPVVAQVAAMSLGDVATARRDAVERARSSRMSAADGATPEFSLSNLGVHDVEYFTGIIPIGQRGLLTVGRAKQRPAVADGVLAVATTLYATLNVDHRHLDGLHAAAILDGFAAILNDPARLIGR